MNTPSFFAAFSVENFKDDIVYQTVGILVVFLALAGLWFIVAAIGACFKRHAARQAAAAEQPQQAAAAAAPQQAAAAPAQGGIAPEIMAVIAAAVACELGSSHRIINIAPIHQSNLLWTMEGRAQIYASHSLR